MGSVAGPVAWGAYQKRARVDQSDMMDAPEMRAMMMATMGERMRRTGSTERLKVWPPKRMVWAAGRSAAWARRRAVKAVKRMAKVRMATARKTPAWRVMTFQKTSAKPRERNHWRSTQEERMVVELKMRARR